MGSMSRSLLALLVLCYFLFDNGVHCRYSISREEEIEIERNLKLRNKPAVKTIVHKNGDIYDCVDFYKQPAFEHPLLKDHVPDFPIQSYYNKSELQYSPFVMSDEICPIGTVPNRRLTKDDFIRERILLKSRRMEKASTNGFRPNGIYNAGFRIDNGVVVSGAKAFFSIHAPRVKGNSSYSESRIRLNQGPDVIEAGWRVDQGLYGDLQTRFFVYTLTSKIQCYNDKCPGFVKTNNKYTLDQVLRPQNPGQYQRELHFRIERRPSGNWYLTLMDPEDLLGYWPENIFTPDSGLTVEEVDHCEWGAEIKTVSKSQFSPLTAEMGSGVPENLPLSNKKDAMFHNIEYKLGFNFELANRIEPYNDDPDKFYVSEFKTTDPHFLKSFFYGSINQIPFP